jgi:Mitochondrial carrier protein
VQVASHRTSVLEALNSILAEGGAGGLFRGLGAASVRVVPMALVSFGTYEWVRLQYTRLEESWALSTAAHELQCIPSSELCCSV